MNLNSRVLVYSYDAGGANLAMAYAFFMNERGYEVKCFPLGPAKLIFENHIPELISTENIEFHKTDTIVTGTSGIHSDYEMEVIKNSKGKVKKRISLLDANANLDKRFSINNIMLEESFLPDEIFCEYEDDFEEYPKIKNRIKYQENLYFKYLKEVFYKSKLQISNSNILKYKGEYLLVLTEYISDLYGDEFGFNEYDFLNNIFEVIRNMDIEIPIFLKLHPAEKDDKYDFLLKKYDLNILKDNYNIQEVLYNCKLLLGLNSSVFKEAQLLEKQMYSVQISAKKNFDTIKGVPIIEDKLKLEEILTLNYKGKI